MKNNYLLYLYNNVFDILFSIFNFIFSLIYRYSGDSWKNSINESINTLVGSFCYFWRFVLFMWRLNILDISIYI